MKRSGFNMDRTGLYYIPKVCIKINVRYREIRADRGEGVVHLRLEKTLIPVT